MPSSIETLSQDLHAITRNISSRWAVPARELLSSLTTNPSSTDDQTFTARCERLINDYKEYVGTKDTWLAQSYPDMVGETVVYFTPEIKIEYLKALMSGGLGALAGDLVEALGDIGVNTIGVSLLYKNIWHQEIDEQGNQKITFVGDYLKGHGMALHDIAVEHKTTVEIPLLKESVRLTVWLVVVGRARIILLEDPSGTTDTLYDKRKKRINHREIEFVRLKQELILGRGGLAALHALNIRPSILHMNEAHCIFAATSLKDALDRGGEEAQFFENTRCVFTTHTPVPAGMRRYPLNHFILMGLDVNKYWQYFVTRPRDHYGNILLGEEGIDLTFAAMILSVLNNAVSREHTQITRTMFPEFREKITGITNGIYIPSWQMRELQEQDIDTIDFAAVKATYKEVFITEINKRIGSNLQADIITVTIARRVTGYKQNGLILSDLKKIAEIVRSAGGRGFQIVFAGKSHPSDHHGQSMMKHIIEISHKKEFKDRVVFVPEYDAEFAKLAAQGSDMWLSNPEEGKEACATSYMKALANGTIVISTPTGGVLEHIVPVPDAAIYAYLEKRLAAVVDIPALKRNPAYNGFYILSPVANAPDKHEPANVGTLYQVLRTAAELYYNYPDEWLAMMQHAVETTPKFDIRECAKQYVEKLYLPVIRSRDIFSIFDPRHIKPLHGNVIPAGRSFAAEVKLLIRNGVSPENVGVQLWYGQNKNQEYTALPMENWERLETTDNGTVYRYWDTFSLPAGINYYTMRAYVKPSEDLHTHIYKYVGKPREDGELYTVSGSSKGQELLAQLQSTDE